jgi:hypothetical protein
MPTPIRYPDTTGFRASFPSTTLKINNQEFLGFVAVSGERTRERVLVYGANADPIGKTRGKNTYKASIGVYLAEFWAFMVSQFGPGWGDAPFSAQVIVNENGYDTIEFRLVGCTIDVAKYDWSESADPLKIEGIELNPIKILINDTDDNAIPLRGAPALG